MWMTRVAIKNPVFCTMVMLALMVMGAVSYFRLPIDAMPEVNLPFAFTVVQYPGASPQAVENDLTKPIENALNTIAGVKENHLALARKLQPGDRRIRDGHRHQGGDAGDARQAGADRPGFPKEAKGPSFRRRIVTMIAPSCRWG